MGKFPIYNGCLNSKSIPPHRPSKPLFRLLRPVVRWALRSGIDYREFMQEAKPVFLEAAVLELERAQTKVTDSSLSLLSGLHRKDVKAWREAQTLVTNAAGDAVPHVPGQRRPSLPAQLVARWLGSEHDMTLPLAGEGPSFTAMAQTLSTDVHPRTLLSELERQGVVQVDALRQNVTLSQRAYMPDGQSPEDQTAQDLLADSVCDHLAAGMHNLGAAPGERHLEQSVFADGLSRESVDALERLSTKLWMDAMARVVRMATPLCERDEPLGGNQRFRMGMFTYRDTMDTEE